jgi:hypothetical protein
MSEKKKNSRKKPNCDLVSANNGKAATARLWAMWGRALPKIPKQLLSVIFLSKFILITLLGPGHHVFGMFLHIINYMKQH